MRKGGKWESGRGKKRECGIRWLIPERATSLDDWPIPQDDGTGHVVERRWKFIKSAAGKQGPLGSFLQVSLFSVIFVLVQLILFVITWFYLTF